MNKPVYFVIDIKINDPEGIKPYQEQVEKTFKTYGGKRIVAGGQIETLEGSGPQGKVVIVQFDSMEKAHAWHESSEYQSIINYRRNSAQSHAYFVQGVAFAAN